MGPFGELIASILLVFAASLLFVDAIEYLAARMRWSSSFTGAIVTPIFTSIPELFIFLVAVFVYSGGKGHEIGLGTIFGEPFMTSTLSYFLVLVSVIAAILLGRPVSRTFPVGKELRLPYAFIALLLPWLLIPGIVHSSRLQYPLGAAYLILYAFYVLLVRRNKTVMPEEESEPPYFVRFFGRPGFSVLQVAVAVLILYFGSTVLIESITQLSGSTVGRALSLSIILIPVATAIPETIAGMIWAFRGKNTLAIGSLVGENVLYATFYPGLALLLIPWTINTSVIISVAGTSLASAMYFFFIRRGSIPVYILPLGFLFYLAFVVTLYM